MIRITQKPKNKEVRDIKEIINNITDIYTDFYITRDRIRLMIKDNLDLFFDCLNKGDSIVWDEKLGIIFITGISDNAERIYIRPLTKDITSANQLIKNLNWNFPDIDIWAKIKKTNPIKAVLLKKSSKFEFVASRGKEILLVRPKSKKESNNDFNHQD